MLLLFEFKVCDNEQKRLKFEQSFCELNNNNNNNGQIATTNTTTTGVANVQIANNFDDDDDDQEGSLLVACLEVSTALVVAFLYLV